MTLKPRSDAPALPDSLPVRRSSGTIFKQRTKLPWLDNDFQLLSIDGGGIKGILPAAILAECEKRFTSGQSAGDYFDMIAGTSTGGIIALALGIGMKASDILKLYLDHGKEIFPPRNLSTNSAAAFIQKWYYLAHDVGHYRYKRAPLKRYLREVFRYQKIGHSDRRLIVPSFDGYTEVHLFKTPHHPDFKMDWKEDIVDAALATSAAPTYFSVFKKGEQYFADGGVWANNPIMNAVVDILSCYDIERRQIHILSLGCGDQEIKFTDKQRGRGGLWHWRSVISSAMHLQSQNAIGQAGLLIGRDQLLRINPASILPPIEMDDYARAANELPDMAVKLVDQNVATLRKMFNSKRPAFQAYYGPRAADMPVTVP